NHRPNSTIGVSASTRTSRRVRASATATGTSRGTAGTSKGLRLQQDRGAGGLGHHEQAEEEQPRPQALGGGDQGEHHRDQDDDRGHHQEEVAGTPNSDSPAPPRAYHPWERVATSSAPGCGGATTRRVEHERAGDRQTLGTDRPGGEAEPATASQFRQNCG